MTMAQNAQSKKVENPDVGRDTDNTDDAEFQCILKNTLSKISEQRLR